MSLPRHAAGTLAHRSEEADAYDQWFRGEVEAALREADAPGARFIAHDQVAAKMETLIDAVEKRNNRPVA